MEGIVIVLRDCLGTVSDYALASLIFTGLFAITYLYVKEHGLKNTFRSRMNSCSIKSLDLSVCLYLYAL